MHLIFVIKPFINWYGLYSSQNQRILDQLIIETGLVMYLKYDFNKVGFPCTLSGPFIQIMLPVVTASDYTKVYLFIINFSESQRESNEQVVKESFVTLSGGSQGAVLQMPNVSNNCSGVEQLKSKKTRSKTISKETRRPMKSRPKGQTLSGGRQLAVSQMSNGSSFHR